ncbi:MAG TPA: EutN/CcmL family microcompartment protein [Thermoanaerobacterales bacterium]|jgi:ethanolamine utilization protein EutN|nr:EutN/CcmL family microcompartment protein [Thermoanaerobacterales bacterium]
MLLAKVVGTVVATKKDETLVGSKLLIVQPLRKGIDDTKENDEVIVAVDSVGAGVGELVLMVVGTTASRIMANDKAPVDAAVIGIVDDIEMSGGY